MVRASGKAAGVFWGLSDGPLVEALRDVAKLEMFSASIKRQARDWLIDSQVDLVSVRDTVASKKGIAEKEFEAALMAGSQDALQIARKIVPILRGAEAERAGLNSAAVRRVVATVACEIAIAEIATAETFQGDRSSRHERKAHAEDLIADVFGVRGTAGSLVESFECEPVTVSSTGLQRLVTSASSIDLETSTGLGR
jgi:hypothetical protein